MAQVIEPKDVASQDAFKIGHDVAESETFIPHVYKDPKYDLVFVDLAGLNDSSGLLINLVNAFVDKFIFSKAK